MILRQLSLGPMANHTYIVCEKKGGRCVVIDPGWEIPKLLDKMKNDSFELCAVLLKHGHYDHSQGAQELLAAFPVPLYYEKSDANLVGFESPCDRTFSGDAEFDLGPFKAVFLHTPGHTPGGCCINIGNNLFTGDTLFLDACGRTDLPGSDPRAMRRSLVRLAGLQEDLVVWPGHAYSGDTHLRLKDVVASNFYVKAAKRGEEDFLLLTEGII